MTYYVELFYKIILYFPKKYFFKQPKSWFIKKPLQPCTLSHISELPSVKFMWRPASIFRMATLLLEPLFPHLAQPLSHLDPCLKNTLLGNPRVDLSKNPTTLHFKSHFRVATFQVNVETCLFLPNGNPSF